MTALIAVISAGMIIFFVTGCSGDFDMQAPKFRQHSDNMTYWESAKTFIEENQFFDAINISSAAINEQTSLVSFFVDSDIHSNGSEILTHKRWHVQKMLQEMTQETKFAIVTGDLTTRGFYWGFWYMNVVRWIINLSPVFYNNTANPTPTSRNELQYYIDVFAKPLEDSGLRVHSLIGNHDCYSGLCKYTMHYISRKEGSSLFSAFEHSGVHFLMCHLYPSARCLDHCRNYLKKVNNPRAPIVFAWHYNTFSHFGDWWSDAEKQAFLDFVTPYNVLGIFFGHWHHSYTATWHSLNVYSTGGIEFCKATITSKHKLVVQFYDAEGLVGVPHYNYPDGYYPDPKSD